MMTNVLYMAVTKDELELPLAVEDTFKELGKDFGIDADKLYDLKFYKHLNYRFLRIEVEEDYQ